MGYKTNGGDPSVVANLADRREANAKAKAKADKEEIDEIVKGAASQVKLLRVLQDRTFEPLGSSRSKTVDVRVVCATNRNLEEMVGQGTFREDLFYRINLITVKLPALRERPGVQKCGLATPARV